MDPESRFHAIFVVAYPALGRYALNRGLSRADAEDLVAATLEIAWRKIDQVPTDDPNSLALCRGAQPFEELASGRSSPVISTRTNSRSTRLNRHLIMNR